MNHTTQARRTDQVDYQAEFSYERDKHHLGQHLRKKCALNQSHNQIASSYLKRVEKEVVEPEECEGVIDLEAADEGPDEVCRLLQRGGFVRARLGLGLGAAGRGRTNLHLSRLDVVPKIEDDGYIFLTL